MDYKKNIRYFENKKPLLYCSAGLLVLGIVLWVLPRSADNWFVMYCLAVFCVIAGGAVFGISLTMRSNDRKIEENIRDAFDLFEEETLKRFDLYERQLPYISSVFMESYKYFDGSYLRRDREGKYRTEIYAETHVYFTEEGLCIGSMEISLIKDEKTDKSEQIPYADIEKAYLTDDETLYKKGSKTVPVKYQTLHIRKNDGTEFTAQAHSSRTLDTLVSDINHIKEKKTNNN